MSNEINVDFAVEQHHSQLRWKLREIAISHILAGQDVKLMIDDYCNITDGVTSLFTRSYSMFP